MAGLQLPPGMDLAHTPTHPPPTGVTPNFTKKSPLLDFTIAVSGVFLPLIFIFLGIRLYMRVGRKEKWMLDDSIVVVTALFCTAFSGLLLSVVNKLAKHSWDVPLSDITPARVQKIMFAQHIFNNSSLFLGKFCLLGMYYRVFGHIRKVRWQLYGTAVLTLPILGSMIAQATLVAPPIGKPWGYVNPRSEMAVIPNLIVGIDNLVVDLLIAYIPVPIIKRLNLSKRKKNGIIALFATGMIAVLTDVVTLYFRIKLFQKKDQLLYGYVTHNCALIESSISVILSSLPSTAKLWRVYIEPSQFFQTLRSHLSSHAGSKNDSNIHHELPSFIKVHAPTKKKRDPYSIGIPTSNHSQTRLSSNSFDVTQTKHAFVKSRVSSEPVDDRLTVGNIHRKISVEQSSVSIPDTCEIRTERHMF